MCVLTDSETPSWVSFGRGGQGSELAPVLAPSSLSDTVTQGAWTVSWSCNHGLVGVRELLTNISPPFLIFTETNLVSLVSGWGPWACGPTTRNECRHENRPVNGRGPKTNGRTVYPTDQETPYEITGRVTLGLVGDLWTASHPPPDTPKPRVFDDRLPDARQRPTGWLTVVAKRFSVVSDTYTVVVTTSWVKVSLIRFPFTPRFRHSKCVPTSSGNRRPVRRSWDPRPQMTDCRVMRRDD